MQFHTIDHSFLSHLAYDEASETLTIVFRRGDGQAPRAYNYLGVPVSAYHEMLEELNPGAWFQRNIRSNYAFEEVGAVSLADTLSLAVKLEYATFAVSPRTMARLPLAEVIAADPDQTYHGDEDCEGNHLWVLGGPIVLRGGVDQRPVWHLNAANGLVVPPTPRLVEKA